MVLLVAVGVQQRPAAVAGDELLVGQVELGVDGALDLGEQVLTLEGEVDVVEGLDQLPVFVDREVEPEDDDELTARGSTVERLDPEDHQS